jgi:hypothetical protein
MNDENATVETPPSSTLQWWEAGEGDAKRICATGQQTGSKYVITPAGGGKYTLTVDSKKVEGVRGRLNAVKKKVEDMEKNLDGPPKADETPAPEAKPVTLVDNPNGQPVPAVDVKTWVAEGRKVEPGHSQTAVPGPEGSTTPLPATTPHQDELIVAMGGNAANNGDATASSWFSEIVTDIPTAMEFAKLEFSKMVWQENGEPGHFVGLTELGVQRYDDLSIDAHINNPTVEAPKGPVNIGTLKRGDVFTFVDKRYGTVGRVEKVQAHEVTCFAELEPGRVRPVFLTPKVQVTHGGILPKDFPPPVEHKGTGERVAPTRVNGKKHKKPKGKVRTSDTSGAEVRHGIPVEVKEANGDSGKQRVKLFGISVTAILRWMGSDGWTKDKINTALEKLGLEIGEQTIISQRISGMSADSPRGEVPELSDDQANALRQLYRD